MGSCVTAVCAASGTFARVLLDYRRDSVVFARDLLGSPDCRTAGLTGFVSELIRRARDSAEHRKYFFGRLGTSGGAQRARRGDEGTPGGWCVNHWVPGYANSPRNMQIYSRTIYRRANIFSDYIQAWVIGQKTSPTMHTLL